MGTPLNWMIMYFVHIIIKTLGGYFYILNATDKSYDKKISLAAIQSQQATGDKEEDFREIRDFLEILEKPG